jgi:hypothetical protein
MAAKIVIEPIYEADFQAVEIELRQSLRRVPAHFCTEIVG